MVPEVPARGARYGVRCEGTRWEDDIPVEAVRRDTQPAYAFIDAAGRVEVVTSQLSEQDLKERLSKLA